MRFRLFYVMLILGPRPGKVVRTTLPRTLHLVARNLGDFALSFAVLPLPLFPEAPHRSPLVRERRRQHRATLEHEAHACCCARVDRPVLVAAAYVQTFGTEVLGPGSPFRELGQFQHRLEQFQRDFDEVFDQCLQARWRSAMRPRALPVESHIEGDQVVIRADLPRVDPKDTRRVEGDRVPYCGARQRVSLS